MTDWQKSSFSNASANCVYVAAGADSAIRLRESDDPEVILAVPPAAFGGLLAAIKQGACSPGICAGH